MLAQNVGFAGVNRSSDVFAMVKQQRRRIKWPIFKIVALGQLQRQRPRARGMGL